MVDDPDHRARWQAATTTVESLIEVVTVLQARPEAAELLRRSLHKDPPTAQRLLLNVDRAVTTEPHGHPLSGMTTADLWRLAVDRAAAVTRAVEELEQRTEATRELLRSLHSAGTSTIRLLGNLDVGFTVQAVDMLVRAALSPRDAPLAREALGRLPVPVAERLVPPEVAKHLASGDDSDWRRMAELLAQLGLADALHALCTRAADSADPELWELAEEYSA